MVSGGMTCVKYLLFLFNLIFAITGVVFITVGGVILSYYSGYRSFVDNWFFAAPVLMIVVGVIVFLISFFGCCGAVKENHCMIITFSVLLLLIFALELGAGISGYMMRNEVGKMLLNRMNNSMSTYHTDGDVHNAWDTLQVDFKCCGINGSADWWPVQFKQPKLPPSCCAEVSATAECDVNAVASNSDGCLKKFKDTIENKAYILGGVGIGVALIQLIGVIFACFLARSIRREYETVETTAH
ncbi:CD63 antigen isoform X2 [Diachasma alloeum]|uniref:CD63 antigen isoform X2 n=1 Tax=Diachasma alloeum TaxID=454923 RepID=UPI00073838F9|nr:CD63 antigen isoform X2 [Diachasma alloeum]